MAWRSRLRECGTSQEYLGYTFGLVSFLQHNNTLSSLLQHSHSSSHPTFSPDWPLIPGFCGPSSLAHLTGSGQGETVVSPLIPANLTFFLGEGRTQRPDLSTSPILLPLASLPLLSWAGRGQRKQSASPAHSLSPSLPAPGRWFTPSPALAQDLAMVSSFSRASRIRGSAWAQAGSLTSLHFSFFCVFSRLTQALCP